MHSNTVKRWVFLLSATFCLLLLSIAYVMWKERQPKLDVLGANNLASSVLIKRTGFDDIALRKVDEDWIMTSPCSVEVSEQRLNPLLELLSPNTNQYDVQEVDLAAAGLESPLAVVFIGDTEYRLGNTDLQGERRYVQHNGRVGFVPEWALSLVNGGVSALADLNVFNSPLKSLTIVVDDQTVKTIAEVSELMLWQNLSAQQIVGWPLENETPEAVFSILTDDETSTQNLISIFETESYTALQYNGTACAYIISPDSLPN